jgi:uncharacterized DUF497 family protein
VRIACVIWLREIVDKLDWKHNVSTSEVEETFRNSPRFRFVERGRVHGEDMYVAMGQTDEGRYLIVHFIHKSDGAALIISARDMDKKERKRYERK